MHRSLEICVDSIASARVAIEGGADRLELCSALAVGGLTPYGEILEQIREESAIPVRCLMRPRAGDFLYTKDEIRQMCVQIRRLRELGADGFVIGCLTPDGRLDWEMMKPLIEEAEDTGLTLHRAFDVSRNLEESYMDAASMGFDTVLTSGGAGNCMAGMEQLGRLLKLRDQHHGPEVQIGAGVNADVIKNIRNIYTNATAFHMSGKVNLESRMVFRRTGVPMGLPGLDEWHIQQTDLGAVLAARKALDI